MQESQEKTRSAIHIKLHIFYKCVSPCTIRMMGLVLCMVFISFCNPGTEGKDPPAEDEFGYDLDTPAGKYKLPKYLEEISGLSYYGKGKIACVQDEKAFIYMLNLEKEKIVDKYDFGSDADYEDIAVVGKTAYILRNNGHIYRIKNFTKKDRKVKKYNTELKEKNDTEGIAFDPASNALLIACKGSPSIDKDQLYPDCIRIVLTGFSDMEAIIQAVNKGKIYSYISKPWSRDELKITIDRGLEVYTLKKQNQILIEDLKKANQNLEQKVKERTRQIEQQRNNITDSIQYASRIQNALLPQDDEILGLLPHHFILNRPKDIVSGDYFWISHLNHSMIVAVADCTGHGVPGAFMSILGINFLNEIVNSQGVHQVFLISQFRVIITVYLCCKKTGRGRGGGMSAVEGIFCALTCSLIPGYIRIVYQGSDPVHIHYTSPGVKVSHNGLCLKKHQDNITPVLPDFLIHQQHKRKHIANCQSNI